MKLATESGQAFTEFLLFTLLSATIFISLFSFNKKLKETFIDIVTMRNNIFDKRGGNPDPFEAYINKSAELCRFRFAYEQPLMGELHPLVKKENRRFSAILFKGYQ